MEVASENIFLLYAVLLGIFITVVYDILRIFRRVISHNWFFVSVEDFFFWVFVAIRVFLLMYHESNGTLRWFAILGAMVGMIVYKKTISKPFVKYISILLQKILQILINIYRFLTRPLRIFKRYATKVAKKANGKKNRMIIHSKNRLKNYVKLLKMRLCKR